MTDIKRAAAIQGLTPQPEPDSIAAISQSGGNVHVEDSVEVPQPAKQTPKFCGKCRGAQNYAAIATGRYPCPNGCEGKPATPPTPIRGACPLCGSKQPDVYLGKCSDYQLRNKPGHLFHWDSTSDAMRAKMVGTPPTPQPASLTRSQAWIEFLVDHPTRGGIAESLLFQAGFDAGRAGVPVEPQPNSITEISRSGGNVQTPFDTPLISRDKEELVEIIERFREELRWYVDERNRLIAESSPADDYEKSFIPAELKRMDDVAVQVADVIQRTQPSAQNRHTWESAYRDARKLVSRQHHPRTALAGVEQPTPKASELEAGPSSPTPTEKEK